MSEDEYDTHLCSLAEDITLKFWDTRKMPFIVCFAIYNFYSILHHRTMHYRLLYRVSRLPRV